MRESNKLVTIEEYRAKKIGLIILLVVGVLMLVVGGFMLSRYISSEPVVTPNPTVEEASPATSAFQTAELAINPAEVYPGVEVIITAQVTNTGDTEDTYTAGLEINGVTIATAKVTIAAGASQPVSFVGSVATPGTHKVTWVELIGETEVPRLTGEFVVVEPDETITAFPTTAPDFTGVDVVTNETISLTQFKGSVILLNFVNYGCSSSLNQIVSAQLLAIRDLREQRDDFVPLSIFCGCCPPDGLRNFAKENRLSWPWILDTNNSILPQYADYLREYGYPTLIFIDEDQQIREVTGYCDISTLGIKIDGTQ